MSKNNFTDANYSPVFADLDALFPAPSAEEIAALSFIKTDDLYQNGKGYIGPQPTLGDIEQRQYIEQSFVPLPKLAEINRRVVKGAVGREPGFEVVVPELQASKRERKRRKEQQADSKQANLEAQADEIDAAQGSVWDATGGKEITLLFAAWLSASSRSYSRFGIPPGLRTQRTIGEGEAQRTVEGVEVADWADALGKIHREVCAPGTAYLHTDPKSKAKLSLFRFEEPKSGTDEALQRAIEISYLVPGDSGPLTRVYVLREDGTQEGPIDYDTGGILFVIGAEIPYPVRPPVCSKSNVQLQKLMCGTGTMVKINGDVAGFPETHKVNIKEPVDEKTGEPVPPLRGPFVTQYDVSVSDQTNDAQGNPKREPRPFSIIFRTPSDSKPLRDDIRFLEEQLLANCAQRHLVQDISAAASGAARIEDRADYVSDLHTIAGYVERALRDQLRGEACFAAHLAGDTERLALLKASRWNVTCHINAGPLTPDEQRVLLERMQAGALSLEDELTENGVEDVDAAMRKIEEEQQAKAAEAPTSTEE